MDQLLTLAERCGLSRSALRFYDQCGLLRPVAVDGATGYRYYDEAQAAEAELVRRLRAAEVPVEDVRAFLAAGPDERPKSAQLAYGVRHGKPWRQSPIRPPLRRGLDRWTGVTVAGAVVSLLSSA
jgi:DNA-binding transcriptional MerR regulator